MDMRHPYHYDQLPNFPPTCTCTKGMATRKKSKIQIGLKKIDEWPYERAKYDESS